MAFEPIFETMTPASLQRLCTHQTVVEARLLSTGGALISKVLSIATDCTVTPSEVFAGEARFSGRASFKVIFTCSEGKNHSMDYHADFTDKLLNEKISAGLKPILRCSVLDTDTISADEREIKLACVVEVSLDAVMVVPKNALTRGGDMIYTNEEELEYAVLAGESKAAVTVSDSSSDMRFTNILLSEARVVVSNRRVGLDSVVLEGNVICDLTCEDEEGMIVSHRRVVPFLEEVACLGAREGDFAVVFAAVQSHAVSVERDEGSMAVTTEFMLNVDAKVFRTEKAMVVTDAFSVTHELNKGNEEVVLHHNKFAGSFSDRVEGSVTLDVSMPIADNLLAVTGARLNIANAQAQDGKILYEGIVTGNILYYSAEINLKSSVAVELPFSILVNNEIAKEGDSVLVNGIVSSMTAKLVRGNEIQIKSEIEVEMVLAASCKRMVLTGLELGEERILPTSAFSVHIAKNGESLWDVAKALGLTPELVLVQNPGLSLPLNGGERVMAYRQKMGV